MLCTSIGERTSFSFRMLVDDEVEKKTPTFSLSHAFNRVTQIKTSKQKVTKWLRESTYTKINRPVLFWPTIYSRTLW